MALTSGKSRTSSRKNSGDSFQLRIVHERVRSPSPTEYYRNQYIVQTNLWNHEQELNKFIYDGIQKFLDKQAVRDLIYAFDNEDIFINGKRDFFEHVFDDFQTIYDKDSNKVNFKPAKLSHFMDIFASGSKSKLNQAKTVSQTHNSQIESTNSTLMKFISSVLVKLFGIKSKHKAEQRRESHLLEEMIERQKMKNRI